MTLRKFRIHLLLAVLALCAGCKEKASLQGNRAEAEGAYEYAGSGAPVEFENAFTPDYSEVQPEPATSVRLTAGIDTGGSSRAAGVVPGIRGLGEYKTKYDPKFDMSAYVAPKAEAPVAEPEEGELFVQDSGPGSVPAESANPTFYVLFSLPVRALSALEEAGASSQVMFIEPPIKGVFRWNGTQRLSFEASEPAEPGRDYTLYVSPSVRSLGGKPITGKREFKIKAEELKITRIMPGWTKENPNAYSLDSGLTPEQPQQVQVRVNYPVSRSAFLEKIELSSERRPFEYSVAALTEEGDVLEGNARSKYFLVKFSEKFSDFCRIEVKLEEKKAADFVYLNHFKSLGADSVARNSDDGRKNLVEVRFTHAVDADSLFSGGKPAFSIRDKTLPSSFDGGALGRENVEVKGDKILLSGMELRDSHLYEIQFSGNLRDVYGRSLKNPDNSFRFRMEHKPSYARFLDSGCAILEAQFPPKLLIDYQNVFDGSAYGVRSLSDKENVFGRGAGDKELDLNMPLNAGLRDKRLFEEVPLEKHLKDGRGFVHFGAKVRYERYDWWSEKYEQAETMNSLVVQVTDLGVTARVGINKVVALVTSLSTGEPVAGAEVSLRSIGSGDPSLDQRPPYCAGRTDSGGVAVLPISKEDAARFCEKGSDYDLALFVQKDGDRTVFRPNSHETWGFDVNSSSIKSALEKKARTFMFVDRMIYKPGETVTFRGIDRDQLLGKLSTPKYGYRISLEEAVWNSAKLQSLEGRLSENGGFYGSFKLPDDIKPATYYITYERGMDEWKETQSVKIIVAEFERAKFQAAVEVPNVAIVAGDSIPASLSASYLAGGSLGGAEYTANWFKSPSYYRPESPETKGFEFGPDNYYDGRDYYSDSRGVLSASGTASITSSTEKISGGKTYRYRVEAAVTDASNQRIVASNSVYVHPAKFYIGVSKPLGSSGFVRAGSNLEFPFILTTPEGKILQSVNPVKKLKYALSHDEWTLVQEKGANGRVYTRYKKETVLDAEGAVSLSARGKISLLPKDAGWYTLRVTGEDSGGNEAVTDFGFYATGSSRYSYWGGSGDKLKLTPDQSVYNPGDTAKVLLESPLPKGRYLVTVEREGIFTEEVRVLDSPASVLEVKVASNYAPVAYVSVSSYSVRSGPPTHEYGEPDLDKPKGYYGVTALKVTPAIKAFSVSITADKPSYRPGDTATLTLKATKAGRPFANTELTVMAVDRGVVDLVNYHVEDPIEFFYSEGKFPLRVKGGDNRAYLMDPVTYSIKDLQGGDSDETKEQERKDFRPTALFEPEIRTDERGIATVTFVVPDSLTTYRVTAFGVRDDLFALSENEIQVRNPVNIQQVQPRRLRVRDTAEAGVLITNLEPSEQNVSVSLEVRSPSGNTAEDELAGRITIAGAGFVDGKSSVTLKVPSGATAPVYFDIAAEREGTVELVYTINSEAIREKLVSPIRIERESSYVYETVTMTGAIGDGERSSSQTQGITIPSFAREGGGTSLKVTLDATRLGLLGGAVNYVFEYPHGCMEQQSARVLPLVIFGEYIDVFSLDSKVADAKKCAVSFMREWKKIQLPDGSFPYWPEGTRGDSYVSARILHIAALARARGYTEKEIGFDADKLASFLQHQQKADSPYALYALALYGRGSASDAIKKFEREREALSLSDSSYLALACLASGDKDGAGKIARYLRGYLEPSQRSVTVRQKDGERDWWDGDASLMANIMQVLVSLNPDDQMADLLLFSMLQEQRRGYWHNTAETSRVLESVYTLIKTRNLDKTNLTASARLNGNRVMEEKFKGVAAKPKTLEIPLASGTGAKFPREKPLPAEFSKDGSGHLYYTLEMKYPIPLSRQLERNEGIGIKYVIEDFDTGVELRPAAKGSALIELEAGKMYKARVTVSSARNRGFVAVRAPVPSGAEILDSALATSGSAAKVQAEGGSWGRWLSSSVIRDNEADFYWDSFASGEASVSFTFRAVRRGVYPTPSVFAECMYEPEIFGRSNAALFVIK